MKFKQPPIFSVIILALFASGLSGCVAGWEAKRMQSGATKSIDTAMAQEPPPKPIVTSTSGAWLMGQSTRRAPPVSPVLISTIMYHPAQRVSLAEIASYITLEKGLVIDVSEAQATTQGASGIPSTGMPSSGTGNPTTMLPTPQQVGIGGGAAAPQTLQSMSINYSGPVSGLLDIAANKAGIWWKFVDGKVVFYRTETKTIYLPTNSRKSSGNSTIVTNSGGGGGSSSSSSSGSNASSASVTSDYVVDVWGDMEKTAKAVGGSAQVVANASAGSLTVTGTPAQVRAIEEWGKELTEQLSQQVAITVHVYRIKMSNEDTYNWDPSIVFKKTLDNCGFCLTPGSVLTPTSGATPVGIAVGVLGGAHGALGVISGSQAAFQALSTMGIVSETLQQTVVTLNGQPAPIQLANQQGYLASSATTQTANVGSTTTLTPGSITVGFTATFLPRIVNGRIILNMTMTNSTSNGFLTVGNATSSIQTPNVDMSTFQQSVSLTPGDALLLTGLQQDKSQTKNSGVGMADNPLLGGGVNSNTDKSMIAIVISAKVL